jgi:hypothetical protein
MKLGNSPGENRRRSRSRHHPSTSAGTGVGPPDAEEAGEVDRRGQPVRGSPTRAVTRPPLLSAASPRGAGVRPWSATRPRPFAPTRMNGERIPARGMSSGCSRNGRRRSICGSGT